MDAVRDTLAAMEIVLPSLGVIESKSDAH
jgi:hypothetical protein